MRTRLQSGICLPCTICSDTFSRRSALKRHKDSVHYLHSPLHCDIPGCSLSFTRKDTFERHKGNQHGFAKVACPKCGTLVRKDGMEEHRGTILCQALAIPTTNHEAPRVSKVLPGSETEHDNHANDEDVLFKIDCEIERAILYTDASASKISETGGDIRSDSSGSLAPRPATASTYISKAVNDRSQNDSDFGHSDNPISIKHNNPTMGTMFMPTLVPDSPKSYSRAADPIFYQEDFRSEEIDNHGVETKCPGVMERFMDTDRRIEREWCNLVARQTNMKLQRSTEVEKHRMATLGREEIYERMASLCLSLPLRSMWRSLSARTSPREISSPAAASAHNALNKELGKRSGTVKPQVSISEGLQSISAVVLGLSSFARSRGRSTALLTSWFRARPQLWFPTNNALVLKNHAGCVPSS